MQALLREPDLLEGGVELALEVLRLLLRDGEVVPERADLVARSAELVDGLVDQGRGERADG